MKVKIIIALLFGGFLFSTTSASSQVVGIKTNLLYWGTTTPNLGIEIGLSKRTTLDLVATYNPWTFSDNAKLKHWSAQPEIRFWNNERFNRGFWGIHAIGGQFNAGNIKFPAGLFGGLKDYRNEGWMAGVGFSYGYQWYLGPHWNLEATFGFGYIHMKYDKFEPEDCGEPLGSETKHYFGPTRIGLSFVYLFKSKK